MEYLPLFFDVRNRTCALVGGNAAAARKAELLLRAGARVRVIADAPARSILDLQEDGRVEVVGGPIESQAFAGCVLAIVALDDAADAEHAAQLATAQGIPVNVVDRPKLCSCIVPAIVDRSPVVVAVSTAGAAPVLGRFLRARLEALLPARLGELAEMARELRPAVAERLPPARRRPFWESVLQGPVAELVFSGRREAARALLRARLAGDTDAPAGEVYLVPTPPDDDPESMTLKALRLLQQADVVIHDKGLARPVLDLIRRDAERRPVESADPGATVKTLSALAREGRRAAWLTRAENLCAGETKTAADGLRRAGVVVQHAA